MRSAWWHRYDSSPGTGSGRVPHASRPAVPRRGAADGAAAGARTALAEGAAGPAEAGGRATARRRPRRGRRSAGARRRRAAGRGPWGSPRPRCRATPTGGGTPPRAAGGPSRSASRRRGRGRRGSAPGPSWPGAAAWCSRAHPRAAADRQQQGLARGVVHREDEAAAARAELELLLEVEDVVRAAAGVGPDAQGRLRVVVERVEAAGQAGAGARGQRELVVGMAVTSCARRIGRGAARLDLRAHATVGMWSTAGPMSEWSDWYRREDPAGWVLPRILRTRAEEHPTATTCRSATGRGAATARSTPMANRVANALVARGLRPGEAVSTLMPNHEENLAVWFGIQKAGGVQCPINLAYKGAFLSWVINLPESRFLVIADTHLDALEMVTDELPALERVIVHRTGAPSGPDPSLPWEPLSELMTRARRRARHRRHVDGRRADHVHVGHHRPLEGRDQAARLRLLLGPHLHRGLRGHRGRHVLLVPAPLPLQRPGAGGVPRDDRRRPDRLRRALQLRAVLAAGDGLRRDDPEHGQRHQLLHLEHRAEPAREGPLRVADHGHAGAEGHLRALRGAVRHPLHRGLRAHRDRDGHVPPAGAAAAAGLLRHRDAGIRGVGGRAGHRPAAAAGDARARSWWT